MNSYREIETAFGRPATWIAGLPALLVGCGAFLLAVYGTWIMPARLRPQYLTALEQTRSQYESLAASTSPSISWNLGETAGEMDVIYSRLIGLEGADANRYWEWGEFLQNHAAAVQRKLHPAASPQPDVRERLTDQAKQFESKSRDIFEQLAAGSSPLRGPALVRAAHTKYEEGLGAYGVRDAAKMVAALRELVGEPELSPDTGSPRPGHADWQTVATDQVELPNELRDEARLLLVQLMIEVAWQSASGSSLTADVGGLRKAWDLLQKYRADNIDHEGADRLVRELQWQSSTSVLAAMLGENPNDRGSANAAFADGLNQSTMESWLGELAELQLAAVKADWQAVAFALSRNSDQRSPAVTGGLARTVCRLACSPIAGPPNAWAEQAELGLLLVAQVAPHLPEFSELLWESGRLQAGQEDSTVALSPVVPEMIARGQNAMLKHSVSALAATLGDSPQVARTHLELIRRAHGSLALVARTALWRVQVLVANQPPDPLRQSPDMDGQMKQEVAKLTALMTEATQLEPDSGLNWFTLGTLQFRAGEFTAMRVSLEKAREILGDIPAIEQMLGARD